MTIDHEKSIYVGGLPYECTDSQLRRAFDLYGSVISVKIINDHDVGGSCYGFVTFKNPRSVIEAIGEMNGQTIGGRVVRVNEVKNRGVGRRSNFGHENLRNNQRDMSWDKGRGRERGNDYDKDRQHDSSREHNGEKERRRNHSRDRDHSRYPFQRRDRGNSRDLVDREWDRGRAQSRNRDREWERDDNSIATQDRELERVADQGRRVGENRDQHTKRKNSSSSCDRQIRELSSEPSDYQFQMEKQLDILFKRREELQEEKSDMEQRLEEKKRLIADLENRSQKLEDSLNSLRKQTSVHQKQLTKLHKGLKEVKDMAKDSEENLQDLVDSVSEEIDSGGGDL